MVVKSIEKVGSMVDSERKEIHKKNYVFWLIMALVLVGFISLVNNSISGEVDGVPKSAADMTLEEREENDVSVLMDELSSFENIEELEIDYSVDAIIFTVSNESTEQYIEDKANNIVEKVKHALNDRRSDLTLEKDDYYFYVYGGDGRIIETYLP